MPPRGLVMTAALYEEVEMNETSHRLRIAMTETCVQERWLNMH
jgi:hypothetical protein